MICSWRRTGGQGYSRNLRTSFRSLNKMTSHQCCLKKKKKTRQTFSFNESWKLPAALHTVKFWGYSLLFSLKPRGLFICSCINCVKVWKVFTSLLFFAVFSTPKWRLRADLLVTPQIARFAGLDGAFRSNTSMQCAVGMQKQPQRPDCP